MSELDKMMAFGHWLSSRKEQVAAELYQLSVNAKHPAASIRVKAGHFEALQHVLEAFTDLYKNDLNKFRTEYLGHPPEDEEESPKDGPS